MAELGIRGFNPIWSEVDLQGHLFDDTFYLFVLENQIPYNFAIIYHDPDLNVPWTNPIRFLGNGTLPVDIYFEPDVVYRLEFRQGDTQADPLIYEVNNYVAGPGGSTPVDTLAFATSNQITNPQFALINFTSPLVVTGTDPDPIQIGPGWFLELGGTGSVTITQVPLNDDNINPSNAPYALRLTLSGWDDGEVFLRQRFEQNGMLWANKTVSSTITARLENAPQSISANLIDSNGTLLTQVLPLTTVNGEWNEYTGHGDLGETTNPDLPPAAYIDYKLALPSAIDIFVTSIQLVVQDLPLEPSFEQDSINRQIDHTYNTAYPIVPVGTIIDFGGFATPQHYLPCDGTAYNRTTYNQLFNAMTKLVTVTLTNGLPSFTVASTGDFYVGMFVEGTGIPNAAQILTIVGTTITLNMNATASGTISARFFANTNGNGTTTFNVYDLRDFVVAAQGGTGILAAGLNGVGAKTGSSTHTLLAGELPPHTHTYINSSITGGAYNFAAGASLTNTPDQATGPGPGASTPFSIVQPTVLFKKFIRFE